MLRCKDLAGYLAAEVCCKVCHNLDRTEKLVIRAGNHRPIILRLCCDQYVSLMARTGLC